jgi:hypothetical protein
MEVVMLGRYLKWTENTRRPIYLSFHRIAIHEVNYQDDSGAMKKARSIFSVSVIL